MSTTLGDGVPYTQVVENPPGVSLGYKLPLVGTFVVESVVAEIDNTGGPDTEPVLELLDKSGAVISAVPLGAVIPAGDDGVATWAWRLAGAGASSASFVPQVEELGAVNIVVAHNNVGLYTFVHNSGASLVNLAVPTQPTIKAAGIYAVTFTVGLPIAPVPPGFDSRASVGNPTLTGFETFVGEGGNLGGPCSHTVSGVFELAAGRRLDTQISNDDPVNARTYNMQRATLVRLA